MDWFKWEGWAEELADLGKLALWVIGFAAVLGGMLLRAASEVMNGKGSDNPDVRLAKIVTWAGAALLVVMTVVALLPDDAA